jgi:prophage regulatory protein
MQNSSEVFTNPTKLTSPLLDEDYVRIPAVTKLNSVLPEEGYVRLPVVFPVSRSTWWAGVKSGRFPQPVKLGPRITAWRVGDIRALINKGVDVAAS